MKPSELAKLLNISPVTLRRWAGTEYKEFLSAPAGGNDGAKRTYTDLDARVLAYVADMKGRNAPSPEILQALKSARSDKWRNLPPLHGVSGDEQTALVSREAVNEHLRALRAQYEQIVIERDEVRSRLESALEDNSKLQKRIAELSEQAAELRGTMQQYTFRGQRVNAVVLVLFALVVGVLLTLAIFLLVHR